MCFLGFSKGTEYGNLKKLQLFGQTAINKIDRFMDNKEAKLKIAKFCAYQERAPIEVEEKLKGFGLKDSAIKNIIGELIDEGFVDEQRYVDMFCKGKFKNNKWGKIKIKQHLFVKKIPINKIEQGLKLISDEDYYLMIKSLLEKKKASLNEQDPYILSNKLAVYLIQKGFESDLVWSVIKELP